MKIKKVMTKSVSILILILSLFSFPSYAEEQTPKETSVSQDDEFENMNLGELVDEIKNLDKDDIQNIKKEVDKLKLSKEKIEVDKVPLKTRIFDMLVSSAMWIKEQLYNLRYPIIILLILYIILKYIQHNKKGGGSKWEGPDNEKQDNFT